MDQRFIIRHCRRFPTHFSAIYMGPDYVGQGRVLNLSAAGMHLLGTYPVAWRDRIEIRLSSDQDDSVLLIPKAVVRWTTGHEFGVRFVFLPASARKQLLMWVTEMVEENAFHASRQCAREGANLSRASTFMNSGCSE